MLRVIVTPSYGADRLGLLLRHLQAQKDAFDEWHLWPMTTDASEVRKLRELGERHAWVRVIDVEYDFSSSVSRFYRKARDPSTTYLRLDDTVCWMCPGFVETMFESVRGNYGSAFSVHANAVGNPALANLHCRFGVVSGRAGYGAFDPVANSVDFKTATHEALLASLAAGGDVADWKFGSWRLWDNEPLPLVAMGWNGAEFDQFEGRVSYEDMTFLCTERPSRIGRTSIVCGRALCATCNDATQVDRYAAFAPQPEQPQPEPQQPEPQQPEPQPVTPAPASAVVEADTPAAPRKKRVTRRAAVAV